MLQFILGTSGTGKTTRLTEELKTTVQRGGRAILLVPEQYSFEAERLLISALGERLALEVEVLSFTRLAGSIFRRHGGLAGVNVTLAGKLLLMSVAINELADNLAIYRRSAPNSAFLSAMVEMCGELKTAGVTPERLRLVEGGCPPSPLRDKLAEISLIYDAYQSLLTRGYTDPEDDLIRASALLADGGDFFCGVSVFVDGFTTFMAAEFMLLEHAVARAESVTFAMTADGLHDEQKGLGVFSPVKSALNRLMRMADRAGVKTLPPILLTQFRRAKSHALAHLSTHYLQPGAPVFNRELGGDIRLYAARDIYGECEYAAARIAEMVREKGIRYNEIVIVARDVAPYLRAMRWMFDRYDIPLFFDRREEAEAHPLPGGVLAAFDAVRSGFDAQAVLKCAKSPIIGLDVAEIAALENYCYAWGVRGAAWHSDFCNNPRGMAETLNDDDKSLLDAINRTRREVIEPLLKLRDGVNSCDGRRLATAIYDFLMQVRAGDNLTAYADGLPQGERESFLDLSAQLWDAMMDILDVFGTVLGGQRLRPRQAWELFRLAIGSLEAGQLPQTLDQVLFGQADRIRPGEKRAVFVMGANEGVFPPQISGGGLFTDAERRKLSELGAELSMPALERSVLEKYFGYFALTLPCERLYVSYARSDFGGAELQPSVLVTSLLALFPQLATDTLDDIVRIVGNKTALLQLGQNWRRDTALTASLREYFSDGDKARALARMDKAARSPVRRIADAEVAKELFGSRLRLSPSRVERFYRCRFSAFAADGLGLRGRNRVEFSPLESGSVIHNVLQVMVQRHGGQGLAALSQEDLAWQVREILQEYISGRVQDVDALPVRLKYLFERLCGLLTRLLMRLGEEFGQSEFRVVAVELPISHREGIKPLELVTPDGSVVTVEGVVDRVDVMEKNGRRYVRVVDYKSGAKEFKLHDILYGLNMQMMLYLFTIRQNGTGELADVLPAGVLYMPVREAYISADRDAGAEELGKSRRKQWRMNGLLLDDEESLRGMEQDIAGVFIPANLKKDGTLDARSSLATRAEMGRLAEKVKELVRSMADALHSGHIAAQPAVGGDYDACAWCDFRAVCGYQQGDAIRDIASVDREEFFRLLEEGEQDV